MEMKYLIKNLSYIKNNQKEFIKTSELAHKRFVFTYGKPFNEMSTTWFYRYYNLTTLTVGCPLYYKFFKDLQKIIRKFSKHKKPLWYQCWLNFHEQHEVLDWHFHKDSLFHGYVSIDPKHTETTFKKYTIKNEVGKLYLGYSYQHHKVKILTPFQGKRITVAFDIVDEEILQKLYKKVGTIDINAGFIPV